MTFQLSVISGADEGRTLALPHGQAIIIGRGDDAHLQLNDATISRNHCRIQAIGARVIVADDKSASGTYVNGEPIAQRELQVGDVIQIGATKLRLQHAVARNDETVTNLTAPPRQYTAQSHTAQPPTRQTPPYPPPGSPGAAPVVLQVQGQGDPAHLIDERVADMREQREARQEYRGYYREDRASNPVGTVGLALASTTMLLAISSIAFREELPFYRVAAGCFGLPLALAALICSIVGSAHTDRRRTLSFIGLGMSILLILMILPALFMDWK